MRRCVVKRGGNVPDIREGGGCRLYHRRRGLGEGKRVWPPVSVRPSMVASSIVATATYTWGRETVTNGQFDARIGGE